MSAVPASDLLLEVTELRAGYGRAEVLHGVSLQARRGSVVTLIGPNGAGKSTLLNAVMGVLPSHGGIACAGRSIALATLEERVLGGIALVPETRALFGTLTVEDNLLLGGYRQRRRARGPAGEAEASLALRRDPADRASDRRDGMAALAEVYALFPRLQERRGQRAATLSGGERQMLALGRALMGRPALLLLDEPSLGLAPRVVRDIFKAIAALRATGVTILLVEQNARAALEVADHAYVLEMGEIVLEGPAATLAHDPRVIEAYLGQARGKA